MGIRVRFHIPEVCRDAFAPLLEITQRHAHQLTDNIKSKLLNEATQLPNTQNTPFIPLLTSTQHTVTPTVAPSYFTNLWEMSWGFV